MAEKEKEGVITAFFSLVLLLVIAMLLCMAESARLGACSRMADSILRLGTKSLLSSYELALYENYHVFGRSTDGEDAAKEELAEELSWYTQQNLAGNSLLCMRAGMPQITGLSVLTDDNGAMFYAQAIQYEKYREAGELAEWLLLAAKETEKAENTGVLLQRTLKAQECAAKAEETLSELLGCLDGFVVEEGAVVRNLFGKIKTKQDFAKKLVPGGAAEWLLAGNAELYAAQRGNYVNPSLVQNQVINNKSRIDGLETGIWELWREYEELPEEDVDGRQILARRLDEMQRALESCRSSLRWSMSDFLGDIVGAKTQSEKALVLLGRLEEEKDGARAELLAYGEELCGYEGKVADTVYEELLNQNEELLVRFSQENAVGILKDIRGMKEALQHNIGILAAAQERIEQQPSYLENPASAVAAAMAATEILSGLRLRELVLDYANVKVPEKNNSFKKLTRQFFQYGILSLVVEDTGEISKGQMGSEPLPSKLYEGEKSRRAFSFKKLFEGTKEEAFSFQCGDIGSFLKSGAETLLKEALYLSYLEHHFVAYADGISGGEAQTEGALEGLLYQLEYIIAGNGSDYGNLAEIAEKIFLIRFAMNLGVIFSSGECRNQIKGAATAAVGFTGIGALIVFVELLLAMVWAAECALTETGGLFMGGEVDFIPSAKSLPVQFHEMSSISKEFWQQKAKKYTESEAGGILKSYYEYLYLFLAVEKTQLRTMRTMDVIQQVMRLEYDGDFLMQHCVCEVETKVEFTVPYLFLPAAGIHAGEGVKQQKKYGISY